MGKMLVHAARKKCCFVSLAAREDRAPLRSLCNCLEIWRKVAPLANALYTFKSEFAQGREILF
jgi:hypothetical protein